eukprot:3887398-Alexandrium_andersonii.AAC.1
MHDARRVAHPPLVGAVCRRPGGHQCVSGSIPPDFTHALMSICGAVLLAVWVGSPVVHRAP